ncbi:MAG: cytidine deaminase [Ruminococcus sp.]|nr:cytidine deaminase [Ruminococcus sp.]
MKKLKNTINKTSEKTLLSYAKVAIKNSHAPYTGFISGAALQGTDGVIYTGCYIENKDPAACICAECAALAKAVSRGCIAFQAIAVAAGRGGISIPCSICRKALSEFSRDLTVIMEDEAGNLIIRKLSELMPGTFCLKL